MGLGTMSRNRLTAMTVLAAVFVLLAASGAVAAQDERAYTGTHVSFDTSDEAVVDYQVQGEQMFDSLRVEAREDASSRGQVGVHAALGVEVSELSNLQGAQVAATATARTSANVDFDGSANMSAHDNSNAVLVLQAGGEEQLVEVAVPADAEAEARSDVVVSTEKNGSEGSFIVVGEGEVGVNGEGDVAAHLGESSRLVFRAHTEGATEDDEQQEQMIADRDVAAEVQFVGTEEEVDGAVYLDGTQAEGQASGEDTVEVSVERAEADGKVVMTTVSEAAVGASDAFDVTVDGEAATEVDSYQELAAALDGDGAAYKVVGDTSAESNAQVLVALDHFSERTFQVSSTDDTTDGDTTDEQQDNETTDDTTDDETMDGGENETTEDTADNESEEPSGDDEGLPGFTFLAALTALSAFALFSRR